MSFGIKSAPLSTNLSVSYTACTKSLFNESCFHLLIKLQSAFDTTSTKEDTTEPPSRLVMTSIQSQNSPAEFLQVTVYQERKEVHYLSLRELPLGRLLIHEKHGG